MALRRGSPLLKCHTHRGDSTRHIGTYSHPGHPRGGSVRHRGCEPVKRVIRVMAAVSKIKNIVQETRELGMFRTTARFLWEFKVRSGVLVRKSNPPAQAVALPLLHDLVWPSASA